MAVATDRMTPVQWRTFTASFLGWTLDAFDFFLVLVVLKELTKSFNAEAPQVLLAVTLTLALRPLGALIFGWIADRYGRRVPLMIDIGLYSLLELLTAFSPNLTVFIILRALFGIAMGGEWGLGAALAMESLPAKRRGILSGVLQEGYAVGNLLSTLALWLALPAFDAMLPGNGWRLMFALGALPALLILFIRASVPESPAWQAGQHERLALGSDLLMTAIKRSWPLFIYGMFFMACFNFMSHGSQDVYASGFLRIQHGFSPEIAGQIGTIASVGAILGGVVFGWLSQRFGRRWMIIAAAVLGLLFIKIWTGGSDFASLALGGFLMQFAVQGAWGIIPAHLNEISPELARGTFPGFVYQLGNLIASGTAQYIAVLATVNFGTKDAPNYADAMSVFMYIIFAAVIVFTAIGFAVSPEKREASFVPTSASG